MSSCSCGNVLLVAGAGRCDAASELVCRLRAAPATTHQRGAARPLAMRELSDERSGRLVGGDFDGFDDNFGFGFSLNIVVSLP